MAAVITNRGRNVKLFYPRARKVRILATLGPASSSAEMIRELFLAGADAFRVNMSHGAHEDHARSISHIRALEKEIAGIRADRAALSGRLRITGVLVTF